MVWTPEPWLGFMMLVALGSVFIFLGCIPLLPGYKAARKQDPTHWVSYVGSVIMGIIVILWACKRHFG